MPLINDTSAPFGERTLAAVMFTDAVNFSGLIGDKEDRALSAVRRDLTLMSKLIAESGGETVKTMGDGLLAYFGSAVNAVACAQEIQNAIRLAALQGTGLNLQHRIGIHLGDVFRTHNDVLGNGVNIAARLQTKAVPGGICISQTVFDVVKSKLTLQVNYLGIQELKNIRENVPAYQVMPGMETTARTVVTAAPPRARPTAADIEIGLHRIPAASTPTKRAATFPQVLVVLGDFSARSSRGVREPLAHRHPHSVDIDNFDEVFAGLGVLLRVPQTYPSDGDQDLALATFEQFHPDELLHCADSLKELWLLRGPLGRPATAASAAEKLRMLLHPAPKSAAGDPGTGTLRHSETDTATIARLLGAPPARDSRAAAKPATSLEQLVQGFVRGHQPAATPARDTGAERAALDLELSARLRSLLHHSRFQALESLWRGLKLLVRDHGASETVKLFIVDATPEEVLAEPTALAPLLQSVNATILLANCLIGAESRDIALLAQLADTAAAAGARLLAGAHPSLVGCESFASTPDPQDWELGTVSEVTTAWEALRTSPAAAQVVLAAPRFLLRQPYGQGSESIDSFPFEELHPSLPHEAYLWGNAAFACAHILATELSRDSHGNDRLTGGELNGLPLHRFTLDGEKAVKPCAEAWLSEKAASELETRGVTALSSIKGRDAAKVTRLVSVGRPAKPPTR